MLKNLLISLCFCVTFPPTVWQPDFEIARQQAREKDRLILLNFSGSDWCGPCIRMRKEIFEEAAFSGMSDTTLILVNADFPRGKKNQADSKIKKQNEMLADKYNPEGKFPFTVLLDADGKILHSWDGLPESEVQFIATIKKISDEHR